MIAEIKKASTAASGRLLMGIGDDCAAFKQQGGLLGLVSTDTLVENVHFDRAWHAPQLLGGKAVAVNMSDIAAMGGIPRYALLSLAVPPGLECHWLERFLEGVQRAVKEYGALLIGGDTVRSGTELMISVTVFGEVAPDQICYRSGAEVGDTVWVSGPLGAAAAGLALLRRGEELNDSEWRRLLLAHLEPRARVALGRELAQSGLVHAMMDISDGLATDLAHLCAESKVGAEVEADALPLAPGVARTAAYCGQSALDWALRGGEDYELLFSCAAQDGEKLRQLAGERSGRELFCIGRLVEGRGVFLRKNGELLDVSYQGYDHFR